MYPILDLKSLKQQFRTEQQVLKNSAFFIPVNFGKWNRFRDAF